MTLDLDTIEKVLAWRFDGMCDESKYTPESDKLALEYLAACVSFYERSKTDPDKLGVWRGHAIYTPGEHERAKLNEKLRQRCDYFDITEPLLSGERVNIRLTWLDRIKRK